MKTIRNYFEDISAIPRASGNEAGIAAYLVDFAAKEGLFCMEDEKHNVFIRKNGSAGREQESPVLLQAHTDMVAEKNKGTVHDFAADGIELIQEGNILHANNTTLGADDGFGVAYMLAVLADETLSHPPLECLFTVSEETGMYGVLAFDFSVVRARRMINLDSAGEEELITGCCGGLRHDLSLPIAREAAKGEAFLLTVSGLFGGHSGEDIHKGRLNAHVLMGKLLRLVEKETPLRICDITGGDKDNAIPRECQVRFVAENGDAVRRMQAELTAFATAQVVCADDRELTVTVKDAEAVPAFSAKDTETLLSVLELPNGVLKWKCAGKPHLSRNLASLHTEQEKLICRFSSRCSEAAEIDNSRRELDAFAAAHGGTVCHLAAYPGWENPQEAPLVSIWQNAYRTLTGGECVPTVIHAGLECGVISAALPGLEAISVGCNIYDLHSPRERMELDSFERIYRVLTKVLSDC